jgi:hypothetical protein
MCGNKEQRSVYLRVSKGASVALAGAPFYGHPTALLTALLLLYYCIIGGSQGPLLRHPRAASAALLLLYYCFTTALMGARRTPFTGTTAQPLPLPLPLLPHPQRIHV